MFVAQSCPTFYDPMAPLFMEFSRQDYWSGLPCPSPGDLPDPGIEPCLLHHRQILYCLSHQVQFSSVIQLCLTLRLQHARLPYSSPSPRACSNACPSSQWCHLTMSSSATPFFSCLQFFPASGSFPMTQFFASGGQSIGVSASASVLPMNIQGWFPLGLTGLISLQSKEQSGVFSNTTFQKHQFFSAQFSYSPTLTSVHDYWKNHSFDCTDLCWQSNVSAF